MKESHYNMKNLENWTELRGTIVQQQASQQKSILKVDLGKCVQMYRAPFLYLPGAPNSQNPPLIVGRTSIAPLTIEGHLWACRSLLSIGVPSHSENWVLSSPELGDRLLSLLVELALLPSPWGSPMAMPLPSESLSSLSCWELSSPLSRAFKHCSPHHRGSHMSMLLPSERLSSLSFWEMSSLLSRAVIQQPQVVRPLNASLLSCSPCW